MCGRYASTRSAADLSALFDALDTTDGLAPDYNLAPTDPAPIVRISTRAAGRVLAVARWGLVPAWSKTPSGGGRMINARAETVATSKAFGASFARRRCLVPAEGWYEWTKLPGGKQPYFMTRTDGEPIVFGGMWSTWGTDSAQVLTFSIVTLPAQGALARVHDRMPLVLESSRWHDWLTCIDASGLLEAPSLQYAAGIETRAVSGAVGDVRNDGPDLIKPLSIAPVESTVETLF
jgi:putative SOS response-associated peptidase YedK